MSFAAASLLRVFGPAFALLGVASCTVGPDYERPDLTARTGATWLEADAENASSTEPSRGTQELSVWWRKFDDAELTALVERALRGNLGLAEAAERLSAVRARRGIVDAERWPSLDAQGRFARAATDDEGLAFAGPPPGTRTNLYAAGLVAGWELDLWGRVARSVEAADAEIEIAEEDLRGVWVALAAEVAREVLAIRELDERLRIVERSVALDRTSEEIATARARGGFASELDLVRARRTLAADEAALPALRAERRAAEHRVAELLGERPGTIAVAVAPQPVPPALPALGVPGELLLRRPDLRRRERELAAAVARIGAAEAERYPRLSIDGTFALSTSRSNQLLGGEASTYQFGPSISLPLFAGGRIDAAVGQAEAEARAALVRLEAGALEAVREVESALVRFARAAERVASLQRASAQAAEAERLASSRYASGRSDFLDVLEAQARRLSIDEQLAAARRSELEQSVALFAALGGGWSLGEDSVADS
ncbi:MAG: efflux transporter outer membrane subunit [Planctomycetes bacterium]|nr:efflux transporter outer membrane subunit [Planctomycetota bacterium]